MKLSNDAYRFRFADAGQGVELGYVRSDPLQGLVLVLKEVDLLEARVVVHEHQEVEEAVMRALEGSG